MQLRIQEKIIVAAFLLSIVGCKTSDTTKSQASAFDLCMANPVYIWSNGKCVARESLLTAKQRCLQSEVGVIWQNNECISADEQNTLKRECLARGDGSTWALEKTTDTFRCVSPTQIVTNKEHCLLLGSQYQWDETTRICLSPTALACQNGGDYWTFDGQCVTPQEYQCLQLTDGSRFQDGRCMGPEELACASRGFQRKWVENANGLGLCEHKSFMEICTDSEAPSEVLHALKVIKKSIATTSCQDSYDMLSAIGSITLDNNQLQTLMPLLGFNNIKSISLQNNQLTDLRVLNELTQLTILYLAENNLDSLSGIENLVNLKALYLAENNIYDLKPLGNLPDLEALYLNRNKIKSLKTLFEGRTSSKGLSRLETLDLSDNCLLTEISDLESLPALKHLYLNRTGIDESALNSSFRERLVFFEATHCL